MEDQMAPKAPPVSERGGGGGGGGGREKWSDDRLSKDSSFMRNLLFQKTTGI